MQNTHQGKAGVPNTRNGLQTNARGQTPPEREGPRMQWGTDRSTRADQALTAEATNFAAGTPTRPSSRPARLWVTCPAHGGGSRRAGDTHGLLGSVRPLCGQAASGLAVTPQSGSAEGNTRVREDGGDRGRVAESRPPRPRGRKPQPVSSGERSAGTRGPPGRLTRRRPRRSVQRLSGHSGASARPRDRAPHPGCGVLRSAPWWRGHGLRPGGGGRGAERCCAGSGPRCAPREPPVHC